MLHFQVYLNLENRKQSGLGCRDSCYSWRKFNVVYCSIDQHEYSYLCKKAFVVVKKALLTGFELYVNSKVKDRGSEMILDNLIKFYTF